MKPNNKIIADNEVDVKEIILILWKEKFITLIITLIFTVVGYIYSTLQPKVYQTTITLRDAPVALFEKYRPFLQHQQQQQQEQQQQQQRQQQISIATNFNQEIKLNLTSLDHLILFVKQSKKLDEFKSYLKKNNINIKDYFQNKLEPITGKNVNPNQYSFTFSKPFPIAGFLSDYINYTKQIIENEFKKQLKINIENEIEIYKQNLEVAKKINLENPILKSFTDGSSVVNEPSALFYKGSKVLSQQIIHLEKLFKEIDTQVFEYNPILESSIKPSLVTKPATVFIGIGFMFGLFFSLIFIFLRSILLK